MNRKDLERMDWAGYCAIQSAISAVQVRLDQFGTSLYQAISACKEAAAVAGKCGPEPKAEATAEVCVELAMKQFAEWQNAVNELEYKVGNVMVNELNGKIEGVLHE